MKGIIVNQSSPEMFFRVWDADTVAEVETLLDFDRNVYTKEALLADPSISADADFLFSTWGMPVFTPEEVRALFPKLKAVLYGAVFNIPATFFTWSAGVLMLSMREKGEKKASTKETLIGLGKAMMSPCMISCFAALALIMGHVTDSGVIGQTFEFAGQLCVPGAMLIVGSSIGKMPLKEMFTNARPYVATLFRLLVIPFAVYFVFSFFITDHLLLGVITICAAMPAASSGTMMCIDFGGNLKTMTQGTFLSTVFSLGTIPTVAAVLI